LNTTPLFQLSRVLAHPDRKRGGEGVKGKRGRRKGERRKRKALDAADLSILQTPARRTQAFATKEEGKEQGREEKGFFKRPPAKLSN